MKRPPSWWVWVGYWTVLFVATHVKLPGEASVSIPHVDKLIHYGVYFLLTWLGGRHRLVTGRPLSVGILLIWAVVYALYAAADEWLQQYTGRTMGLGDWIADVAGIAAATAAMAVQRRATAPTVPGRGVR